jgi:hypothetical protein
MLVCIFDIMGIDCLFTSLGLKNICIKTRSLVFYLLIMPEPGMVMTTWLALM